MPEQMAWQFALQLVTMGVTALAGWLAGRIKGAGEERKKKGDKEQAERDTNRAVIRLLLYYRIHDLVTDAEEAGCMSDADKQKLSETYDYYHESFDGNGSGTQMFQRGMALPSK